MPVCSKLAMSEVYCDGATKPDWKKLKTHFTAEGRLDEEVALRILREGAAALKSEPNLLTVSPPVTSKFSAVRRIGESGFVRVWPVIVMNFSLRGHPRTILRFDEVI